MPIHNTTLPLCSLLHLVMFKTSKVNPTIMITKSQSKEVQQNQAKEELQNFQLSYQLNARNYLQWSQMVKDFVKGKWKLSHLMGIRPAQNDLAFVKWDKEASMIMSWLWNSMLPKASGINMFLTTMREIQEIVYQTYSKMQDTTLIYEIKTKIAVTKQC